MVDETEGVIKFQLQHSLTTLQSIDVAELDAWRVIFKETGTIGQVSGRYDGYGFGNLSQRTGDGFLISGTQTGNLSRTSLADYAEVVEWDSGLNSVRSRGDVSPSSESLTHGVIYDVCPDVMAVFHLHSPDIWKAADMLGISVTDRDITYGTPEMAEAVKETVKETVQQGDLPGILSMGGHDDGIVGYGRSLSETGLILVQYLVAAKQALA